MGMCGRFQRRADKQKIAEAFSLGNVDGLALELDLTPNYNAAPQSNHPVVILDEAVGMRALQMMFWRFLPSFAPDLSTFRMSTINASAESVQNSSMWRGSFVRRRCLVPADTFIEWQPVGKKKLPWVFAMKDESLFALGGVWRHWQAKDRSKELDTFAVITVDPNELVTETTQHSRMPLIIMKADWQRWLEPGDPERPPIDLLRPFDSELMKAWRSGSAINFVKNTGPELDEPLKEDETQIGMF